MLIRGEFVEVVGMGVGIGGCGVENFFEVGIVVVEKV